MEIKETVAYVKVVGHICDICGNNVNDGHKELYSREPAILRYENHTTCRDYRCELCQDCFFKVADFVRLIGGNITEKCWNSERSDDED